MNSKDVNIKLYMDKIQDELKCRYKLKDKEIHNLFEVFAFEDLAAKNEGFFFYQSPEYWADFLVSP